MISRIYLLLLFIYLKLFLIYPPIKMINSVANSFEKQLMNTDPK